MATLTQISQALNDLLPKLKPLSMPTGMLGHFYSVPDPASRQKITQSPETK